jgi:hypothetical protein
MEQDKIVLQRSVLKEQRANELLSADLSKKQAQMPQSGNIPPSWRRDGQGGRPLSVSTEGAGVGFINQNGRNPKI